MQKNVASQKIGAQMVSATDGSAFAAAVTVYVTGDAGTQAAGSVGSGACTHEGNGYHTYAPAQAETNYDLVAFTFIGTGAVPSTVQVFTGFPQTGDNYARLGAPAGASVSADVAAVKAQTAAIETDTQDLQTQVGTDGAGLTAIPTIAAVTTVGSVTGAVGSVTGAVGSVTGAVGSVTGAVGSVTGNVGGSVASVAANGITATSIAADAINAAAVKADAVTKIQTGLATPTNITAGTITTATNLTNLPATAALEATLTAMKGATFAGATDSLEALRDRGDAAWTTATGFATAANLATLAGYVDTEVASILAAVDTEVAAIKAKTDNLPTDPADQSAIEAAITAATSPLATAAALATVAGYVDTEVASILAAVDTEVGALIATVGVAGAGLTALATQASVNTIDDFLDTEVAAILADTNELQTDLVNGGRLDLLIDAIKAKTDVIPASPAATGAAMTLTAAYDAAKTAATQTSVNDLPTNAELATALAGADDAMLTAIADVPTVAEFEARTLAAANYATAAALAAVDDYVDTEVAAIKAVTDKIDTALVLDGAVYQLTANALELAPTGGAGGLDAAGVRAAVGLATANLDTQLADIPTVAEMNARTLVAADYTVVSDLPAAPDNASIAAILVDTGTTLDALIKDVPTNAELATALGTADDATLAAIAALNNLSSAQAQTAATAALNAYDPPTNAEMVARTLLAASYFDPATDTVAHVTLADTVTTLTNMPATPSTADIKTALEADGSKLDHLWEMTADDGGVRQLTANALELAPTGGSAPTAGAVADAVWDEALSGHVVVGSAGAGLTAAGNAGDPWAITLPGDYTSDQAGYFISLLAGIDISAVTVTASNDAGVLTIIQSVTFGATVSGLTISGTWAKVWWSLKENIYDDDSEAIIQLVATNPAAALTDGLLYLDGAAIVTPITFADGVLTVNQAGGIVTIWVSDNATVLLAAASELVWDIKTKDAAGATVQNTTGTASIVRAVTQTI